MLQNLMKFFQNRPRLCTILYILGFITSGVFTLMLLISNSVDTFSKVLATSMTTILEFGKGITYVESKKKDRYSANMRSVLFGMWVFTTLLSIFASQAFLVNETNKISHNTITNSTEYRQLQDKETRLKEQITIKKDLLNKAIQDKAVNASNVEIQRQDNLKLIQSYNQTIKDYQRKIDTKNEELQQAINKKWVNTPDKLRSEISQLRGTLDKTIAARDKLTINDKSTGDQEHIDQLNRDIDVLNKELNSINYTNIKTDLPSNGYIALFQLISNIVALKLTTVTFLFYLIVTVGFEVLICLLYHIAVVYSPAQNDSVLNNQNDIIQKLQDLLHSNQKSQNIVTAANNNIISGCTTEYIGDFPECSNNAPKEHISIQSKFQPSSALPEEPLKTKNPIGFRPELIQSPTPSNQLEPKIEIHIPDTLKKEDIQKYLKVMYEKTIGDIAPGSDRIAKILSEDNYFMSKETARKIRGILEQYGIIKCYKELKKTVVLKWI